MYLLALNSKVATFYMWHDQNPHYKLIHTLQPHFNSVEFSLRYKTHINVFVVKAYKPGQRLLKPTKQEMLQMNIFVLSETCIGKLVIVRQMKVGRFNKEDIYYIMNFGNKI